MAQNIVIPNKDNLVTLTFAGVDLTLNTDIHVSFGAETYTRLLNPTVVTVDSATQLSLDLSGTSEVGQIFVTVTYFDAGSTNGTDITSQEIGNLGRIIVAVGTQLTIETGAGVANANSYASDAEMKAYADLRGLTVPSTQPEREALLVLAMDYIEAKRNQFKGCKTAYDQALQWPRHSVYIDGYLIDSDSIPVELKNAQIEAAILGNTTSLVQSGKTNNVASESIGDLSVSYFSGGSWESVRTDNIDVWLDELMQYSSTGINARAFRI
jgi:hypothetical protein